MGFNICHCVSQRRDCHLRAMRELLRASEESETGLRRCDLGPVVLLSEEDMSPSPSRLSSTVDG